ncbi:P-loop containing nucleoside triphosphate hydrolase [Cryptosporidium tyzzeri]|nr:P-loop containing nucleoside triphosphate hydrolase [Cryptosporidium tyzzeri]
MPNDFSRSKENNDLFDILELDEETKNELIKNDIKTIPQLLLDNLRKKGLKSFQEARIYSKCREKITCFPNNVTEDQKINLCGIGIETGFVTGKKLLEEARENWSQNGDLRSHINLGSDILMDFFDGGFLAGETTELFGHDLPVIRRFVHWIISNTMFNSTLESLNVETELEGISPYQVIYIQTTDNSFDPIFMKKCFQRLCGELEMTQNSQYSTEISHNLELLLSNICVVTVDDCTQLQKLLYDLPRIKQKELKRLKLVVIDPITSLLGSHNFIEAQELSNNYYKEVKEKIFIVGRLIRYVTKALNISSVVTSLAKQSIKQTNTVLGYCSNQLLCDVNYPKSVHFEGFGTFYMPPPTRAFSTEIDYNWFLSPHNRILIENIGKVHEEYAGNPNACNNLAPHNLRILRWTIFKSNRLPIGKYVCAIFDKIGLVESECQFF